METITKEYFDEQIYKVYSKLDSLVEINQRLIDANILLNDQLGNRTTVASITPVATRTPTQDKKKLYYRISNGHTIISGSTFDVKAKLKDNGFTWVSENKSWRNLSEVNDLSTLFPGIEEATGQ